MATLDSLKQPDVELVEVKTDLSVTNERTYLAPEDAASPTNKWSTNIGSMGRKLIRNEFNNDVNTKELDAVNSDLADNYYTITETSALITLTNDSINNSVSEITSALNVVADRVDVNEENINVIQADVTSLTQTSTELELAVTQTGGVNLLKNSCGLKGNIREWQIYDDSGVLVDNRNNGTLDTSSDTANNTESGSAIKLNNQFLTSTIGTILGVTYTLYFRYTASTSAVLTLTGVVGNITIPASTPWISFKYQFVATSNLTTIRIENSTTDHITLSDLVFKRGDINGWIQAPNEVYGKNFVFDKDGFTITSLTDPFKSLLDNTKLAVYDTSSGSDRVVMLVSKDSGKITSLYVQDLLQIQRYEDTTKATRIIPTATGSQLVIND